MKDGPLSIDHERDQKSTALSEAIEFVSSLTGISVVKNAGSTWRFENDALYLGENYYLDHAYLADLGDEDYLGSDGRSMNLFSPLFALDVWTVYRTPKKSINRAVKRRSLAATQEKLEPLLKTIDRLEAMNDMLRAMPGYRRDILFLLQSGLTRQFSLQQPFEQFLALIIFESIGADTSELIAKSVAEVTVELKSVVSARPEESLLQRVLNDPAPGSVRMERLVALLMPGFLQLLKQKAGLTTIAGGRVSEKQEFEEMDFASTSGDTELVESDAKEGTQSELDSDERESQESDTAEGADLFESTGAAAITNFLETPIATTSPQMLEMLEMFHEQDLSKENSESREANEGQKLQKSAYRVRVDFLKPQIEQMLNVWRKHLTQNDSPRNALSKFLEPQGEHLDDTQFAKIVADAKAGVARPAAFKYRVRTPRRNLNIANTDYVLVIDRSSSMQAVATQAADAALILMESLAAFMREIKELEKHEGDIGLEVRTSLIVFDYTPQIIKPLSAAIDDESRFALYDTSKNPQGATNDAEALLAAAGELKVAALDAERVLAGKKRKRVVIVVSDGHSSDLAAAEKELQNLKRKGVEVWGIGIGDDAMKERYSPFYQRVEKGQSIAAAIDSIIHKNLERSV